MAAGRKSKVKAPRISAPPQITESDFISSTGDTYRTRRQGNTEISDALLSPQTRSTVNSSMDALDNLAQELYRPDARRVNDIANRAQDFYDLQAENINAESDNIRSQTEGSLAKRFGGAYNASFGADALAQVENNRLNRLYDAGKEATLFGEDLYARDEDSRSKRFQLFSNYLTNQYNQQAGLAGNASGLLENEAGRAQDLAITRANLAMKANLANQQAAIQRRGQTLNTAVDVAKLAVAVAAL